MMDTFPLGYVAVIGVDTNNISQLAMPTLAENAQATAFTRPGDRR